MDILLVLALVVVAGLAAAILVLLRAERARSDAALEKLGTQQAELAGRLGQMGESQASAQAEIARTLEARLETVSKRIGDGLHQQSEKAGKAMSEIHERLAVIDSAQKNLTELSQQMVSLQDILSNKQARGNFGEIQLQDLVTAALPPSAYAFQATLSNGRRADCLLQLPNPPGAIVIDAKFPLESYQALRNGETEAEKTQAARAFSADVMKHVKDIAARYIVDGETAESALMFLPSEAVYAELHANFRNVVEDSFRHRVWIVSPTTLMATLNTVRAVLKDARMREQAGVIQAEVHTLLKDVGRLDDRVGKLQRHFGQAEEDLRQVRISTEKVTKRGEKIDALQFEDDRPGEDLVAPSPQLEAAEKA